MRYPSVVNFYEIVCKIIYKYDIFSHCADPDMFVKTILDQHHHTSQQPFSCPLKSSQTKLAFIANYLPLNHNKNSTQQLTKHASDEVIDTNSTKRIKINNLIDIDDQNAQIEDIRFISQLNESLPYVMGEDSKTEIDH